MKFLKHLLLLSVLFILIYSCGSSPKEKTITQKEKPVVIENDSLEYEVIIIDPGFTYYLNAIAQPRNFYSQSYMETRNTVWVNTWNMRARNPSRFNSTIYENSIDYRYYRTRRSIPGRAVVGQGV